MSFEGEVSQYGMTTLTTATASVELPSTSKAMLWAGRILSGLGVLFLALDGTFKLFAPPEAVQSTEALGWPGHLLFGIGVTQLVLLVLYLIPRTSVLGALLWVGYLGGAVATHVRVGNPLFSHVLFPTYIAALLWVGLWLREPRLRALLPLRAT